MSNNYFQFKQFTVHQEHTAMKVTTDSCLFGAWAAGQLQQAELGYARMLDIGTGTGLLSLMLAQAVEGMIDAVEIDEKAARQAEENVSASPWADRIRIWREDARIANSLTGDYDVIISNPPFYENELASPDQRRNLAHHSEELSLQELVLIFTRQLSQRGRFFLMLPFKRMEEVMHELRKAKLGVMHYCVVRQSPAHQPFRILIHGGVGDSGREAINTEMMIREGGNVYSQAFIELLRPYYLHL